MSMCRNDTLSANRGRSSRWSSKKLLNSSLLKSSIWSPEKGCNKDTNFWICFSETKLLRKLLVSFNLYTLCNLLCFEGKFNRECQKFTINQHFSIGPHKTFLFITNVQNRWFSLQRAADTFLSQHYDEGHCRNIRSEEKLLDN